MHFSQIFSSIELGTIVVDLIFGRATISSVFNSTNLFVLKFIFHLFLGVLRALVLIHLWIGSQRPATKQKDVQ